MPEPYLPIALSPLQWLTLAGAATFSGLAKTGIPGINVLSVSLFAMVLPPRASTGMVLPILICADWTAILSLRQHADWEQLRRLFPPAALGVVAGWATMSLLQGEKSFARLMGTILFVLVAVQLWRKRHPSPEDVPQGFWWPTLLGALAGFTTMVSNAAGPLLILYLLGRKLPKMAIMGTAAWFFCLLNLLKFPFSVQMGLITPHTLPIDLWLAPCAIGGALLGRLILPRLPQRLFETIALTLTTLAALKLWL